MACDDVTFHIGLVTRHNRTKTYPGHINTHIFVYFTSWALSNICHSATASATVGLKYGEQYQSKFNCLVTKVLCMWGALVVNSRLDAECVVNAGP